MNWSRGTSLLCFSRQGEALADRRHEFARRRIVATYANQLEVDWGISGLYSRQEPWPEMRIVGSGSTSKCDRSVSTSDSSLASHRIGEWHTVTESCSSHLLMLSCSLKK